MKIRPIALAIIKNNVGQMLLQKGFDRNTGQTFYRPLGGGVEFGERSEDTVAREIMEELSLEVEVGAMTDVLENIFVYEGKPGHEICFLYEVKFKEAEAYRTKTFDIIEGGKIRGEAVWRSRQEITREKASLFPTGF